MKAAVRRAHSFLPLVLASCSTGTDHAPGWIRLAAGAGALPRLVEQRIPGPSGRAVAVTTDPAEALLVFEFARGDWRRETGAYWSADLPTWTLPHRHGGPASDEGPPDEPPGRPGGADAPYRMRDEQGAYELWSAGKGRMAHKLPPRQFTILGKRLYVNPGSEELPGGLALEVRERRQSVEEGHRRLRGFRFSGEGFVVWPGEELELRVDIPPRSALHLGFTAEPRLLWALQREQELAFSVRLDGVPLSEERITLERESAVLWRSLALPAAGGTATLSLSVQGPFAHTAFLAPTIGPLAKGAPGARPAERARRDVILFLADTFRADNLAAYGGRGELAPFLNGLAERSRVFTHAWSTSTFTLPAHASVFTGLFPRQAGIVDSRSAISRELQTLAEFFGRLGYRTGAVTDKGFVSHLFGMDQGFQFFDEHKGSIADTAERVRAFLDADDGRPVFLFVQTFRTHMTYEASPQASAALGLEPLVTDRAEALQAEHARLSGKKQLTPEDRRRVAEVARELESHYRAGVWDLDRGFERIHRDLEARGFFRNGCLVFTSDHGEAFHEHEHVFHGGEPFDEVLRVPLFLHGAGLEAGRVDAPASLVDLPRTLADLVGAEPLPEWQGTSLLDPPRERAIYGFEIKDRDELETSCVIEGERKVIGQEIEAELGAGEARRAFDLASDPRELHDLAREAWPGELLARHRAALEAAQRPRFALTPASPSPEELQALQAMGYAGGDE
jgi:arylsulfatase